MNKKAINFLIIKNEYLILFTIIIINFLIDKSYHANTSYLPKWDQGYHLTNLFSTYNTLENFNLVSFSWWNKLWSITDSYRGPLTYILSSLYLFIFGKNYENSLLSNNIFSIISILCIFKICKEMGNERGGLWGAFIFAFNPYIFDQRVDYLIDISQVCFINLNFYILLKLFKSKGNLFLSFLLGITLGFLFLTKPTGLLFLILPYLFTFLYPQKIFESKKIYLLNIFIFIGTFFIIVWPWLSLNWITIFTTILNSWQWGIKYQEGLEANTLEGVIFYPKIIFKLINPYILGSFFVIGIIDAYRKSRIVENNINDLIRLFKRYFLLIALTLNILIICTLMSTKDLRFILPIFPSLCIFAGLFIAYLKKYYWINYYKLFIFLIIISNLIFHIFMQINISQKLEKNSFLYWPHKEIIEEVNSFSPNINSVIAVLPDTKELNTFNLAAEASLQNKTVDIRQIISNEKSLKYDLQRFNWFLIKDGEQGIMSNDAKVKLSKLLKNSNDFENFKSWKLPDGSKAKLYKRKKMNESIEIIDYDFSPSELDLFFKDNRLTINLRGKENIINNSYLLVNAKNNEKNYKINIALPKIINLSGKNIELTKNIYIEEDINLDNTFELNCFFISKKRQNIPISIDKVIYDKNMNTAFEEKFEINKIKEVEKMGKFLQNGEFDKLFNLVGAVNQSDPYQEYLKDAEEIFKYRYQLDNTNIDYLYNIAISQILQRKSLQASKTLLEIQKIDSNNPHLYLAKSIVDIYNFKPRKAERNILIAKKLNKKESLRDTINTVNLISNIVNLRIRSLIDL